MISILARGCPPGANPAVCPGPAPAETCLPAPAPPGAFSPAMHPGTCYEWTSALASPSWWAPWRIAVLAVTVTIVALLLTAYFRSWSRLSRMLLAVVAAWAFAVATAGLPWDHLYHLSLAAVVICGVLSVVCIVTLRMTREARS